MALRFPYLFLMVYPFAALLCSLLGALLASLARAWPLFANLSLVCLFVTMLLLVVSLIVLIDHLAQR